MPKRRQKLPCPIGERATPFVAAGNGDPGGQRPGVLEVLCLFNAAGARLHTRAGGEDDRLGSD